jgi:hypothetical protein
MPAMGARLVRRTVFEGDFNASLFPLKTNPLVVTRSGTNLKRYIEERILCADPVHSGDCFLTQQKAFAAKPQNHLRRTVCLDPVASYYLYDLMYRLRNSFRKPVREERKAFGYRFQDGKPIPVHAAFEEFRKEVNFSDFVFDLPGCRVRETTMRAEGFLVPTCDQFSVAESRLSPRSLRMKVSNGSSAAFAC